MRRCRVRETAEPLPRPYVGVVLLALAACGPGNVAPDDDAAVGDDDAFTDDDLTGDDDAVTDGTGTISVTVEVLAVLQEGQSVEAEIVVDGTPTGVFAPAEIEAETGTHTVTLKANEPDAPIPERFIAAPHDVSVSRDGTVACPMFLGRDLTGTWQPAEDWPSPIDDLREIAMIFGTKPYEQPLACVSGVWIQGTGHALCLITEDQLWAEYPDTPPEYTVHVEGSILDSGNRIEYRYTSGEGLPPGPWVLTRVEE